MPGMEIWEASPLFEAVQRSGVFPDGKTFLDCTPRRPLKEILADYLRASGDPEASRSFDLRGFVMDNFAVPQPWEIAATAGTDVSEYIESLWKLLERPADDQAGETTLLPLPHPYVVPGGRFREIYYWDSYFTMLGLRESGREALIVSMLRNFATLISRHGFIPNGNRRYYLSRSQPPYFALMVELAAERDPGLLLEFRDALQAEHAYWMDRTCGTRHVVTLPDGSVLNRYWDLSDSPRPESFVEDETVAAHAPRERAQVWRDLRAAAESGWDFSSRWLADRRTLETIETTDILPVDLNCLLHRLETVLARAHDKAGDTAASRNSRAAADARARAIERHFWSSRQGYFYDFHLPTGQQSDALTLAGVTPLFLGLATHEQAHRVAAVIEARFLAPGGVVTTVIDSGQQWDLPNGWAPLQWITIQGLRAHGCGRLAAEIAQRWVRLNRDSFARTGQLLEKYNVMDTNVAAGGGEYAPQHGFGWTNGVLLALMRQYPPPRT